MKLLKGRRSCLATPLCSFPVSDSAIAGLVLTFAFFTLGARRAWAIVHASIVVDAQSGQVLQSHNANSLAHPASLTKLMTLYITFEQLERGKLKLGKELHVSRHAAAQQPTKLWLHPGSRISVQSAILGIVTQSANDAAVVLAEGISGSESRFALLMNRTAHRLGMKHTRFYNASGLPNARQWTTARDMSTLALALIGDFPGYYHFFSVRSFRFHGHQVYGHDHLLDLFAGTDGLKTGYIRASGYNLVTSAVRHDRRLVGVVLGGATAHARDRLMMTLLARAFSSRPSPLLEARSEKGSVEPARKMASVKLVSDKTEDESLDSAEDRQWVVQVGRDFSSQQSVRRSLKSAARTAPASLRNSRELVVKLRGNHYRARFARLSEDLAASACRRLSRKGFTCRYFNVGPSSADRAEASLSSSDHPAQTME